MLLRLGSKVLGRRPTTISRGPQNAFRSMSKKKDRGFSTSSPLATGMDEFLAFERSMRSEKKSSTAMQSQSNPKRNIKKPVEPKEGECCGLDCASCVWIVYQDQLLEYEAANYQHSDNRTIIFPEPTDPPFKAVLLNPTSKLTTDELDQEAKNVFLPLTTKNFNVIQNRELCQPVEGLPEKVAFRSARHIELEAPNLSYYEADTLKVYVPNPPELVTELCKNLGFNPAQRFHFENDSTIITSLYGALRWSVDLQGTPRRTWFRDYIISLATDERERQELIDIAMNDSIYKATVLNPQLSIVDVLKNFPSVYIPSIEKLLQILPELKPRPYTISSSPNLKSGRLSITMRVLSEAKKKNIIGEASSDEIVTYNGIASSYLADCNDSTIVTADIEKSSVFESFREAYEGDDVPLIMVAAGTGVAPFRSFLQAEEIRQKNDRDVLLFHGCRHPKVDAFYSDEIQQWLEDGVLTHYFPAFSKHTDRSKYVFQEVEKNADVLYDAWVRQRGKLYVCGSAPMVRQLESTLSRILQQSGESMTLESLQKSSRYNSEAWTVRN